MTDQPGEAYIPRYVQLIKRLTGAKSGEPLHEFAPELLATLVLENDRSEYHILGNQVDWSSGSLTIAAVAARVGQVEILNPSGSGILVVITLAKVVNAQAGSTYQLSIDPAAAATPTANLGLDTRAKSVASQNRISNTQAGVSGIIIDAKGVTTQADATFELPSRQPIVLGPGHRLAIFDGTVNQALTAIFGGYERPIEPEELSP